MKTQSDNDPDSLHNTITIQLQIQSSSVLGQPERKENIGETQLPYSVFLDYIVSLAETKFKWVKSC